LDGRDLYRHRLAADAIYRATYQRELARTLGVEWTAADSHGNRELQGLPEDLVRLFSKRTEQIDAELERLAADGRERTPRLVKWTVHATRGAEGDLGHVWPDMAWLARRVPATATAQDGPKVGVARSPTEVTRAFARIDRTMRWQMPTLADVLKARFQISAHLRQTPLLGYPTG
jgi:TrwC relaxase